MMNKCVEMSVEDRVVSKHPLVAVWFAFFEAFEFNYVKGVGRSAST